MGYIAKFEWETVKSENKNVSSWDVKCISSSGGLLQLQYSIYTPVSLYQLKAQL